jgi:peptidoglycan L-alanyl-D-glutamate endopeptidase CwlK
MIHRDLNLLTDDMRHRLNTAIARLIQADLPTYVYETLRDDEVQAAYCAQGRMPLDEVNALRKSAGLYLITEAQNRSKITTDPPGGLATVYKGVGHGNGTAADLVPLRDGDLWWNAPEEEWTKRGVIYESAGLVWGGRWAKYGAPGWDGPHVQLPRRTPA